MQLPGCPQHAFTFLWLTRLRRYPVRRAEGCRGEANDHDAPAADQALADRECGGRRGRRRDHWLGMGGRIFLGCRSPARHRDPGDDTPNGVDGCSMYTVASCPRSVPDASFSTDA